MASETFKKRQKETARKEKKMQKLARRLERKNEKVPGENSLDEDILKLEQEQAADHPGPTNL
ncbi:MAG: hypothetical protein HW419_3297 [Deltaproteobacteria bacterium]|nr:hypothetical protein [Deltaproteobacteria bacterium]